MKNVKTWILFSLSLILGSLSCKSAPQNEKKEHIIVSMNMAPDHIFSLRMLLGALKEKTPANRADAYPSVHILVSQSFCPDKDKSSLERQLHAAALDATVPSWASHKIKIFPGQSSLDVNSFQDNYYNKHQIGHDRRIGIDKPADQIILDELTSIDKDILYRETRCIEHSQASVCAGIIEAKSLGATVTIYSWDAPLNLEPILKAVREYKLLDGNDRLLFYGSDSASRYLRAKGQDGFEALDAMINNTPYTTTVFVPFWFYEEGGKSTPKILNNDSEGNTALNTLYKSVALSNSCFGRKHRDAICCWNRAACMDSLFDCLKHLGFISKELSSYDFLMNHKDLQLGPQAEGRTLTNKVQAFARDLKNATTSSSLEPHKISEKYIKKLNELIQILYNQKQIQYNHDSDLLTSSMIEANDFPKVFLSLFGDDISRKNFVRNFQCCAFIARDSHQMLLGPSMLVAYAYHPELFALDYKQVNYDRNYYFASRGNLSTQTSAIVDTHNFDAVLNQAALWVNPNVARAQATTQLQLTASGN